MFVMAIMIVGTNPMNYIAVWIKTSKCTITIDDWSFIIVYLPTSCGRYLLCYNIIMPNQNVHKVWSILIFWILFNLFHLQLWCWPLTKQRYIFLKPTFLDSRTCGSSEFHCNSGQCIQGAYKCDKDLDCVDGSDEGNFCSNLIY